MSDDDDPARGFLDQTVPRDDAWEGREPEDGPARPRHVAFPDDPDGSRTANSRTAKERRREAARNAAWTFGPGAAYLAGSAFAGRAEAEEPEPEVDPDLGGIGEIGSGL